MKILLLYSVLILRSYGNVDFEESGKTRAPIINEKVFYKDFLDSYNYYNKYEISSKKTNQSSLAYVTPWNSRGYDVMKKFGQKFSHLSPVWLRITPSANCRIEGVHDIDEKWMNDVRAGNPQIAFVPRFIFDGWSEKDFQALLRNEESYSLCSNSISNSVQRYGFDGIVLEIWLQHSGTSQEDLINFIKNLYRNLHKSQKQLILVVPPSVYQGGYIGKFSRGHFDALVDHVDFMSLMTYDYSNPYMPGPSSPIFWVRDCISTLVPDRENKEVVSSHRAKLMVGLNFYGQDLIPSQRSGKPIIGHEFVNLVSKHHSKFHWNSEAAEHFIEYEDSSGKSHEVFFPSILSISRRLSLFEELGTGISVWEVGQGLDSFYDLF